VVSVVKRGLGGRRVLLGRLGSKMRYLPFGHSISRQNIIIFQQYQECEGNILAMETSISFYTLSFGDFSRTTIPLFLSFNNGSVFHTLLNKLSWMPIQREALL
jgi:hypothetical protein